MPFMKFKRLPVPSRFIQTYTHLYRRYKIMTVCNIKTAVFLFPWRKKSLLIPICCRHILPFFHKQSSYLTTDLRSRNIHRKAVKKYIKSSCILSHCLITAGKNQTAVQFILYPAIWFFQKLFLKLKLHTHIAYDKKDSRPYKRNVSVPFFHRHQSSAHIYADCEKTLQPLFFDAQSPHPNIKYSPQEQPFRGRAPAI